MQFTEVVTITRAEKLQALTEYIKKRGVDRVVTEWDCGAPGQIILSLAPKTDPEPKAEPQTVTS